MYLLRKIISQLSGECNLLGSVSSQQSFEETLKPSSCHNSWTDHFIALRFRTDHVIALRSVLQLRVTAPLYLKNSRKIHPGGVRACRPKEVKKREREGMSTHVWGRESTPALWLPFLCFFLPSGPALCKLD